MTKANIVLAAAALVFAAGCFVLFKDLNAERNRVKALETQVDSLQRDVKAAAAVTPDTASAPTSELPAQAATVKPSLPAATPSSRTPAAAKPAAAEGNEWRAVLADPEYRKARLAEHRLRMRRGYPQLVAELGLSADEAERFLDLLAEHSLRENELAMKEQPGQNPMNRRNELQAQADKERRAFLGEERFRKWVEYVNSASARGLVDGLRTELATTNSPLREEQVKPLVKALAEEHQRHTAERQEMAYMERRATLIEESLDRQQEAAEMHLDSVQQRQFNVMLERRREDVRVELASWRAQFEAEERRRARSR